MDRFAALLGTKGLHHTTFTEKQAKVIDKTISACDVVLAESATAVKTALRSLDPDIMEDGPVDISQL